MADDPEALSSRPFQDAPDPLTGPLNDLAADLDAHPDLDGDTDYRARQYVRRHIVEKAIPQAQQELGREYDNRGELVTPDGDERITLNLDEIRRDIKSELGEFARRNEDWLDDVIAETIQQPFGKTPDPVQPNQPRGGDPVIGFSGEFVYQNDDFRITGAGIDLTFRRTYRNQAAHFGPLGANWDHQYNVLLWASDHEVVLTSGELRTYVYRRHPAHGYFEPPDGEHSVVLPHGESFVRRAPDGVRHVFAPDPEWPGGHRLARIEDRHGNYLAFGYADGRLDTAQVNHPDRVVRFDYDERGRLAALSDHTGRQWRYTYDDLGNLTAFVTPGTEEYPDGLATCYEYRTDLPAPFTHDLVRVVDPAGQTYLENSYGDQPAYHDFNGVVRQRTGAGETLWQHEAVQAESDDPPAQRPVWQTNEIDPCGHPIHHVYNKFGNVLLREEAVGGRLLRWRFRYNADGEVTASLSPEGVLTQYLYGRDYFVRRHGITDAEVAGHDALTAAERMAFGRVLAVVRRAHRVAFPPPGAQRVWAEGLPELLGVADPDDIIVRLSYEPDHGQLRTRSDPRFTASADPGQPGPDQVTRYTYTGPPHDPNRLLAAVHEPEAGTLTRYLDYDERGRLLRVADPVGTVTEFGYHDNGIREGFLRSAVLDPTGLALTTSYEVDELGRVVSVRPPRAAEAPGGFVTGYVYNPLDQLTSMTSPAGHTTRYGYDRNGQLCRIETDARNDSGTDLPGDPRVHTYRFDEAQNLRAESLGGKDEREHLVARHRYDAAERLVRTVLPAGNLVDYRYDERHRLVATTLGAGSPDAATSRVDYDGDDLPVRTVSARGRVTETRYDTFGRPVQVTDPLGTITRRAYDKAGNRTVQRVFERRATGLVLLSRAEYAYDLANRPVTLVRNLFDEPLPAADLDAFADSPGPGEPVVTETGYDPAGRVIRTVDPLGRVSHYDYDAAGRLTAEVDPAGHRREHRYDAHGNRIRVDVRERVAGGEQVFSAGWTYDQLDRPSSATDGLGNTTQVGYDSLGNVTRRVDPLGNLARAEFDLFGRQRSVTDANATTRFDYDRNGNLEAVHDAQGRVTRHSYDALDRPVATELPDGSVSRFGYDPDGDLVSVRTPTGVHRRYHRDAAGRPTRVTVDGPATVEGSRLDEFSYDGLGRLIAAGNGVARVRFRIDSLGRTVADEVAFGSAPPMAFRRDFDHAGAVVGRTYPGGRRLRLVRDELDRLVGIEHRASGAGYPGGTAAPVVAQCIYHGLRLGRVDLGNGAVSQWRLDGAGRPIGIMHTVGGREALAVGQLFDGAGNLRLRSETTPSGGHHEIFGYDTRSRLATAADRAGPLPIDTAGVGPADRPLPDPLPHRQHAIDVQLAALPAAAATEWSYDPTDNRLAERRPGAPPTGYLPNELDQYLQVGAEPIRYDGNGNLVDDGRFRYGYDGWDRLTRITDAATGSDLAGFAYDALGRRVVEVADGVTTLLFYDGHALAAEYRAGSLAAQYVSAGEQDPPVQVATDGAELYPHTDLVGSIRLLSDTTGQVAGSHRFDAFGVALESSGPDLRLGFAGRRRDPATGDYGFPLRTYRPAIGRFLQRDPLGQVDGTNLYGYAGNNPLVYVDPLGAAAERVTPGAPSVPPDAPAGSPPTSITPAVVESGSAPPSGGAPEVLLPADQWVEPKREPEPSPLAPGPAPPDEYFSRLVYNAQQWAKSSDDDYRGLRHATAFLGELIFGLPLSFDELSRARAEEGVRNSFADILEDKAARSTSADEASLLRNQARKLRIEGFQGTQAAAAGIAVAAVLRGRGSPVNRKVAKFKKLGYQDHHIFTNKTAAVRDHDVWKLAGREPDTRFNKMLLPARADLHPTRSIHIGRHDSRLIDQQLKTLDEVLVRGRAAGWGNNQALWNEALVAAIKNEKRSLVSGHRALNKNYRPWADR